MGLLDDVKPRYMPPRFRSKKYKSGFDEQDQERLSEINNMDRKEVTEDFGDSPFADRKEEKENE